MTGTAARTRARPAELESAVQELRLTIGRLTRRLRDESTARDLTWPQVMVLARLDREGPTTTTALARADGMRPQSMGAIVAALEDAGFVAGTRDPADGRQTLVGVTDAGCERLRVERRVRQDWLWSAVTTRLSPSEQRRLVDAVGLLSRLAEA